MWRVRATPSVLRVLPVLAASLVVSTQASIVSAPGLWSTGSGVVVHGFSCSQMWGIFPDQGWNLCLLHWQADCLPLSHQGCPKGSFYLQERVVPEPAGLSARPKHPPGMRRKWSKLSILGPSSQVGGGRQGCQLADRQNCTASLQSHSAATVSASALHPHEAA